MGLHVFRIDRNGISLMPLVSVEDEEMKSLEGEMGEKEATRVLSLITDTLEVLDKELDVHKNRLKRLEARMDGLEISVSLEAGKPDMTDMKERMDELEALVFSHAVLLRMALDPNTRLTVTTTTEEEEKVGGTE